MNIAKILECCPNGTELYSPVYGKVTLEEIINNEQYPIKVITDDGYIRFYTKEGKLFDNRPNGECVLFPSKEQRDWNKFNINQPETVLPSHDIEQNYKRIPFNVELAKKIVNGEFEGRIVTMEGRKVRIICWDKKPVDEEAHEYPIVALIQNNYNGEMLQTFTAEGAACYPNYKSRYDLIIEIPAYYYQDYFNFEPQKYQPCLVRNDENSFWGIQVYSHTNDQGKKLFYDDSCNLKQFTYVLPISKDTKRLIGTRKSYEKLIQELKEIEYLITEKRIKQWTQQKY